jgi:hypothetical protein
MTKKTTKKMKAPAAKKRAAPKKRRARKPAVAASNPPRKYKRKRRATSKRAPARRAASNPPTAVFREAMGEAGAALVGGAIAAVLTSLVNRIVPDQARDVAGVLTPTLVGTLALQMDQGRGQAMAAGAFGLAGARVAGAIADAVTAARNPPLPAPYYFADQVQKYSTNPPPPALIGAVPSSQVQDQRNATLARYLMQST